MLQVQVVAPLRPAAAKLPQRLFLTSAPFHPHSDSSTGDDVTRLFPSLPSLSSEGNPRRWVSPLARGAPVPPPLLPCPSRHSLPGTCLGPPAGTVPAGPFPWRTQTHGDGDTRAHAPPRSSCLCPSLHCSCRRCRLRKEGVGRGRERRAPLAPRPGQQVEPSSAGARVLHRRLRPLLPAAASGGCDDREAGGCRGAG